MKRRYANPHFRQQHKATIRKRYANPHFRQQHKATMGNVMRKKYANPHFRHQHKALMKSVSKNNYNNTEFKQKRSMSLKMKYRRIDKFRQNVLKRNLKRAELNKLKMTDLHNVIKQFRQITCGGPEYVCSVCFKLLFKSQVMKCIKSKYMDTSCISEKYLHVCNPQCTLICEIAKSDRSFLWICFTCHNKLRAGKLPAEANINNLQLNDIPEEIAQLNNLEQHLIGLHIPFMKLMALPKGAQNGVHGPVVCVPSNTNETVEMLPRPETEDQTIRVKLKRKLSYKSYYKYKYVNKSKVLNALQYLKQNNKWYSDVTIDNNWENSFSQNNDIHEDDVEVEDSAIDEHMLPKDPNPEENNPIDSLHDQPLHKNDVEDDSEERLCGIQLDTCLQPANIGQDLLDQCFDEILCCAPCEGNSPVSILKDESNEAKCFPSLFPKGQPTFHDGRSENITLGRYLQNRLMHVDNRFAQNTDYIFYAQYIYEMQQVLSQVSIALRQGSNRKDDFSSITASDFKNVDKVYEILKADKGYRFLKQIRGTPPYWQNAQKNVLAMVRQLGKPTWFGSFSSADLRWPEIMNTLLRQTGDARKIDDLDWADKCNLLKSNPVTVARMFDKRFHTFLKKVILSPSKPIGNVIDYFYRIEFQQRGSPHVHILIWIENAPILGVDKDENVVQFIDKYISCEKPTEKEDPELHEIVSHVQSHSKKHSKSCKKKGTTCRFNFPRPISKRTFITKPVDVGEGKDMKTDQKNAKELLESVKNELANETNYESTNDLFEKLGITQEQFEKAYAELASQESIILKRKPQDVWINQFNPHLLRCWNANMDLQYVSNVFACVSYVVSYLSKAEREVGMLLSHTLSEIKEGNNDAKQSMKKLGQAYMHNREVSAQESVYRVCSLRLKECSRKVEYIPVGPDPIRISLPLKVIQNRTDDNEENIWMTSKVDRYKARPDGSKFDNMCLASFCSEYRILTTSQMDASRCKRNENVFELKQNLGYIQKRTRSDDAVIRYPRFNPKISPENYNLSLLQLFLPYRTQEQLKPPGFETYEHFIQRGYVNISGKKLEKVKSIVIKNRDKFEKNADAIDEAKEFLCKFGPQENAWALLCPETEAERLEYPKEDVDIEDFEADRDIPDLKSTKTKDDQSVELRSSKMSKHEGHSLIRTLNEKQKIVFYNIRQWCLNKVNGGKSEPFHIFVTGGAGTGKSHLVKCIYYEGTRILGRMLHNPDDIPILKIAPTGVAAFNINGSTIHSALSIPLQIQLPYQPLSEEKISTLRNKLAHIQVIIIDEISMVHQKLMCYIHGRLRQIKQSRNQMPFGGISVIAVGDFYQLPPVFGTPLYKDTLEGAIWIDNFKKVELDDIMRQKDDSKFALLLNKLRVKSKEDKLCDEDIETLQSRETGEDCENVLHIYSTNKHVQDWNKQVLHKKCTGIVCILAEDTQNTSKDRTKVRDKPLATLKSSLAPYLWIAVNARVMLTRNIDVEKGLTNGCFGNVVEIVMDSTNSKPVCIKVEFDKSDIGIYAIEKHQESVKKYVRQQFPLKLAYACTIHKVQGMSLDKAVVSLKNMFEYGQAYVGLSRVTSLSGLVVQDFHEDRIYCNPEIKESLENMHSFIQPPIATDVNSDHKISIILHNVQGLKQHYRDLKCNTDFSNADLICLTETWLNNEDDIIDTLLDDFKFYHQPRYLSYCATNQLREQSHGGVAIYTKIKVSSRLNIAVDNLESIAIIITNPVSFVISVIYRPPSYSIKQFCECLLNYLNELHKISTRCIVMGDFNEDLMKHNSQVNKIMCDNGYKQYVSKPTTENGTLIDHVYSKGLDILDADVFPIYYSYHEAIRITL